MSSEREIAGPRLALDGLSVGYGRSLPVLDDVTVEVRQGVTLLLGANGAGKSSLMTVLAQARRPRSGTLRFSADDRPLRSSDARRLTGLLPQAPAFPSALTGSECVEYVAWSRRVPRAETPHRVEESLALAHAEHVSDIAWSRLSYGTKQRVAIAAALVNQPSFLLLDEPLNGLDIAEKRSVLSLLTSLPWPAAVLVSSHVLEHLEDVAHEVVVLADRSCVYAGSRHDLVSSFGSLEDAYLALQAAPAHGV